MSPERSSGRGSPVAQRGGREQIAGRGSVDSRLGPMISRPAGIDFRAIVFVASRRFGACSQREGGPSRAESRGQYLLLRPLPVNADQVEFQVEVEVGDFCSDTINSDS